METCLALTVFKHFLRRRKLTLDNQSRSRAEANTVAAQRRGVAMAISTVSSRPARPPTISCVDSQPFAESHWRSISLNRSPNYQGKQRESLAIPTNCLLHGSLRRRRAAAAAAGGALGPPFWGFPSPHSSQPLRLHLPLADLFSVPLLLLHIILAYPQSWVSPSVTWCPRCPSARSGVSRDG